MKLNPIQIQDWITALKTDSEARITPTEDDPDEPAQPGATWGLSVYASAYFGIKDDAQEVHLRKAIPQSFAQFDLLTGSKMDHFYYSRRIYGRSRTDIPDSGILNMAELYAKAEDFGSLNAFSGHYRKASPQFSFDTINSFHPLRRIGVPLFSLDYLSVALPLSFWRQHRAAFQSWWIQTLNDLQAKQAYMGLKIGLPPVFEGKSAIEFPEYHLAQAFYGLDIDKPFFMCSNEHNGLYLDDGMRTPSFGVLVADEYLEKIGGQAALMQVLSKDPAIRMQSVKNGYWIEAGDEPRLYPREEGVPASLALLAQTLKPARLVRMDLSAMTEGIPIPDMFNVENSAAWLARFDHWREGDGR